MKSFDWSSEFIKERDFFFSCTCYLSMEEKPHADLAGCWLLLGWVSGAGYWLGLREEWLGT